MKIVEVEAFEIRLPMSIPYVTALSERAETKAVVGVVRTDEGLEGVGQATTSAPLYAPHEETPETVLFDLKHRVGPAVIGLDPFDIAEVHRRMDRVAHGHPYAHTVVDLACYDLMGRATGRPVHQLLGGALREEIPLVAPHLGYLETGRLVEEVEGFLAAGFRAFNLRVGRDLEEDLRNLSAIRKKAGDEVTLDTDFSQSLSLHLRRPDLALSYLRRLEEFRVSSFEQPLAAWDLEGMARLAQALDTPIVADESVFTPQDALRVVRMGAADVIKIKIIKTGGFYGAMKIAAIAETAGVPLTVGHGLAPGIQTAAEAHFASTLSFFKLPGEMNGVCRIAQDVTEGSLKVRQGRLMVPRGPGLGLHLDRRALELLAA